MIFRRRQALVAVGALVLAPAVTAVQSEDGDDQALIADADYAAGLVALKAGDLTDALRRFRAALPRFSQAATLHNELGYTYRRLGELARAFEHYKLALSIDPRHRGAHEYIGEAYLMANDVASAERHLAALRSICLLPCDEFRDLDKAIAAYRAQNSVR